MCFNLLLDELLSQTFFQAQVCAARSFAHWIVFHVPPAVKHYVIHGEYKIMFPPSKGVANCKKLKIKSIINTYFNKCKK